MVGRDKGRERIRRTDACHFRHLSAVRLSVAGGTIRKSAASVPGHPLASGRNVRILFPPAAGRSGKQHLCSGGFGDADRSVGQERHSDYRNGQPIPAPWSGHSGIRPERSHQPSAPHPDDIVRIHLWTDSVGIRHRSRRVGQPLDRNSGRRRYAGRDSGRNLPGSGTVHAV